MKETLWENNLKFVKNVCIIQLLIIVPKKKKKHEASLSYHQLYIEESKINTQKRPDTRES